VPDVTATPKVYQRVGAGGYEDADADELARRQVPPGALCPRPQEIEHPAPLLVAAKRLDQGAQRGVQDQIEREDLAVEPLASPPEEERAEDEQLSERLVELGGMDGNGVRRTHLDEARRHLALVGERLGRELRRPGEMGIAGRAPAAARGEAAEPADGVTDGDGRDERVRDRKERHPVPAHVPDRDQDRPDEPPVEDETAFPEGEDLRGMPRILVPVDDDEEHARPDRR